MVDCLYTDDDGVERWHVFDVSEGEYGYIHSRERLLSRDEMTTDWNCNMFGWVHAEQLPMPRHRMELAFRAGETLERVWGNYGVPYQDNIRRNHQTVPLWERGAYAVDYGNGRWSYSPDLARPEWVSGLAEAPSGLQLPRLAPAAPGRPATAVWHFRTPYIVASAAVRLSLYRRTAADKVRLHFSMDNGATWREIWESPDDALGAQEITVPIGGSYTVKNRTKIPENFYSPFGLYSYGLKLELVADNSPMTAESTASPSIRWFSRISTRCRSCCRAKMPSPSRGSWPRVPR
jgi:hypothetical protein